MSLFRCHPKIDCNHVRDLLEDLDGRARRAFAKRTLPLVDAELAEIDNLLRPIAQAFRRACSSLEDTELPADAAPALRPSVEVKQRAAVIGHYAAMGLDFALGLAISRLAFMLSWMWSIGFGLFLCALAMLSRLVASVLLDRRRPAKHVGLALRLGVASWVVLLTALLAVYLVRTGVLGVGLLGILIPVVWLAFLAQSVSFAVLVEAFSFPGQTYERHRTLVVRKAELAAIRDLLEAELPSDEDGDAPSGVPRAPAPGDTPISRAGYAAIRPRGRSATRASRMLGLVTVVGALALCAPTHAGPSSVGSVSRVVVALDESPGTEDTQEFLRVRRALADGLAELTATIPHLTSIGVLHWSDAATVWAAEKLFVLPRQKRIVPLEAGLALFEQALSRQHTEDAARDRALQSSVLEEVRRELLSRSGGRATQSCVTQLVARAVESPANELWLVLSDLQDYNCPTHAECAPGGAQVCAIAIPQRQGAETRQRVAERTERLRKLLPEVVVVPSWEVDDPESVCRLALQLGATEKAGSR